MKHRYNISLYDQQYSSTLLLIQYYSRINLVERFFKLSIFFHYFSRWNVRSFIPGIPFYLRKFICTLESTIINHLNYYYHQSSEVIYGMLATTMLNSGDVASTESVRRLTDWLLVVSTLTSFNLDYEYMDGRSQIKVCTDKRTPAHGAQCSLAVTHPGTNRGRCC